MDIILVDDDIISLKLLEELCSKIPYVQITGVFTNAKIALQFSKENPPDLALLDIMMPEMNGLDLCDKMREYHPELAVFFTTASDCYALSAYRKHALSYITKPYQFSELSEAFERAKRFCSAKKPSVFIRTFGHFDVFLDGASLCFPRQKCKELFAFLIDRMGGIVTMEQIIDTLWENRVYDKSVRSYAHVVLRDLKNYLKSVHLEHLLISRRNQTAIDSKAVNCDYFRFLNGDPKAVSSFEDEYMIDYSWAETTTAILTKKKQSLSNNC